MRFVLAHCAFLRVRHDTNSESTYATGQENRELVLNCCLHNEALSVSSIRAASVCCVACHRLQHQVGAMDNAAVDIAPEGLATLSYDDTVAYEEQLPTEAEIAAAEAASLANRIGRGKVYLLSESSIVTRSTKVSRLSNPHVFSYVLLISDANLLLSSVIRRENTTMTG